MKTRHGLLILQIASICAALSGILYCIDGRPLVGGVWLCLSALLALLERS